MYIETVLPKWIWCLFPDMFYCVPGRLLMVCTGLADNAQQSVEGQRRSASVEQAGGLFSSIIGETSVTHRWVVRGMTLDFVLFAVCSLEVACVSLFLINGSLFLSVILLFETFHPHPHCDFLLRVLQCMLFLCHGVGLVLFWTCCTKKGSLLMYSGRRSSVIVCSSSHQTQDVTGQHLCHSHLSKCSYLGPSNCFRVLSWKKVLFTGDKNSQQINFEYQIYKLIKKKLMMQPAISCQNKQARD